MKLSLSESSSKVRTPMYCSLYYPVYSRPNSLLEDYISEDLRTALLSHLDTSLRMSYTSLQILILDSLYEIK